MPKNSRERWHREVVWRWRSWSIRKDKGRNAGWYISNDLSFEHDFPVSYRPLSYAKTVCERIDGLADWEKMKNPDRDKLLWDLGRIVRERKVVNFDVIATIFADRLTELGKHRKRAKGRP